jgi:hypothetical protein
MQYIYIHIHNLSSSYNIYDMWNVGSSDHETRSIRIHQGTGASEIGEAIIGDPIL